MTLRLTERSWNNRADREEFKRLLKTRQTAESQRYSDTLAEKIVYYALKLDDGTVIRVSSERDILAYVALIWLYAESVNICFCYYCYHINFFWEILVSEKNSKAVE